MKNALRLLSVSALSVTLGSASGILVALSLYSVFPALYQKVNNLPLGIDLGPAAGFEFVMLAIGLLIIVSNMMASVTGIAIWSYLQRKKLLQS